MSPATTITCIGCGGIAHLVSFPPEDDAWEEGEVVTYRCGDCGERWDLVLGDEVAEDERERR